MEQQKKIISLKLSTLSVAKVAMLLALYLVSDLIPISPVIGSGGKFISLRIILAPVIAYILNPSEALVLSIILIPFKYKFPPFSFLQPLIEIELGSLIFHFTSVGGIVAFIFLVIISVDYLITNFLFPFYPSLHLAAAFIALFLCIVHKRLSTQVKIPLSCYVITMCSHGIIMPFFIHIIPLPWETWIIILPMTAFERSSSVIGSTLIIFAIMRVFPRIRYLRVREDFN